MLNTKCGRLGATDVFLVASPPARRVLLVRVKSFSGPTVVNLFLERENFINLYLLTSGVFEINSISTMWRYIIYSMV